MGKWERSLVVAMAAVALSVQLGCAKTDTTQANTSGASTVTTSTSSSAEPDSSSTLDGSPSTSAASTTSTGSPASPATDQKAAESALITTADVPAGFTAATPSSSTKQPDPLLGIAECAPFKPTLQASDDKRTAKAKAEWKDEASEADIDTSVEVYTDVEVARDSAAAMDDPGFPSCLEALFRSALTTSLPADATIGPIKATVVDVGSAAQLGVDSVKSFSMVIDITLTGQTFHQTLTNTTLTSGRAVTQVNSSTSDTIDLLPLVGAAATALKQNAPA